VLLLSPGFRQCHAMLQDGYALEEWCFFFFWGGGIRNAISSRYETGSLPPSTVDKEINMTGQLGQVVAHEHD
jgi:hypothetical protein